MRPAHRRPRSFETWAISKQVCARKHEHARNSKEQARQEGIEDQATIDDPAVTSPYITTHPQPLHTLRNAILDFWGHRLLWNLVARAEGPRGYERPSLKTRLGGRGG